VASRKCDHCGASVPADEQFCPSCGTFLDPLTAPVTPRRDNVISVTSDGNYEEFKLDTPPREEPAGESPQADRGQVTCPSCNAENPSTNRHCQECGARLRQGPLPTAPRPAVQATAGVRAALAISALLFAVVVIALLFNVFNGSDTPATTTVAAGGSTTLGSSPEIAQIEVISAECVPPGIGSFVCDNLISGTEDEYQVTYEELADGEQVVITLIFREPMTVNRIDWYNLADETQFRRNYRARGISIDAQGNPQPFPVELEDSAGVQQIAFAAVNTTEVVITIESAYLAEPVEGNVFKELAIQELTLFGYPATPRD
jgi:zinc-ribbon domain